AARVDLAISVVVLAIPAVRDPWVDVPLDRRAPCLEGFQLGDTILRRRLVVLVAHQHQQRSLDVRVDDLVRTASGRLDGEAARIECDYRGEWFAGAEHRRPLPAA